MTGSESDSSWTANFLLVGAALLFVVVLIAGVEGGLRLAGLGAPDVSHASRLKYQKIYFPILEPTELADGTPVWQTADQRLPHQSILREKPEGSLRIFTFGGSATAGLGFSPNVTFARQLEGMLLEAYPTLQIEMMNLGIVALSSRQVKLLVADVCQNYEPDLLIVYSGNNEFLEIHAEKFAAIHTPWLSRIGTLLGELNLTRLVQQRVRGTPAAPSLADRDFGQDDLRVTQRTIVEEVELSSTELESIYGQYEANLEAMARAAKATETPLIMMTVAANWKWRGREDLPEDWLSEFQGAAGLSGDLEVAKSALTEKIEESAPKQRHEWLFRRAIVEEELGDIEAARRDYRAAMNADPHLRRATDGMNDRVRSVAERNGITLVDTVQVLSRSAEQGIVGFGEFYDYVHFTPRGVLVTAAAIFEAMREMGIVPASTGFDVDRYASERIASLADGEDRLALEDWLGFGFDPSGIRDRDLWKYDRMVKKLSVRLEENPDDVRALVYRGNASYFRIDGAEDAERDYLAALGVAGDDPEIRRNLERARNRLTR